MSGLNVAALRQAIDVAKLPDPPECFYTGVLTANEPCGDCGQPFEASVHTWPIDRPFEVKLDEAYMQLVERPEGGS